jgi:NDP-sugar pyrophosphorylase family protein
MKSMILAAGFGTRLQPLTNNLPKALMPVANQPMIARVIEYLKDHGVREILVNAHHQADQLIAYLDKGRPFGISIEIRKETEILGTGGGLKNSSGFWGPEPFIVINSDVLTNIPLDRAYADHQKSGNLASLVLHDLKDHSRVLINADHEILDISPENKPDRLSFTGIHILDPAILDYIPSGRFYHIMDIYRELIRAGKKLNAHVVKGHYWYDIGSIDSYKKANQGLSANFPEIGLNSRIEPGVHFKDWAIIGPQCVLEQDVEIAKSVLWDHVRVKKGCRVLDSIVTADKLVEKDLIQTIF